MSAQTTHILARPERKLALNQGVQRWEFPEGDPLMKSGHWRAIGGLAWPEPTGTDCGVALVLGFELASGALFVLAEHAFAVVDPVAEGPGLAPFPYLADFLNRAWADYACDNFHWSGSELDFAVFLRRIMDSKAIRPQPSLPLVDWLDETRAARVVFQWSQSGKLVRLGDGLVSEAMRSWEADRVMRPALWALASALAGFDNAGLAQIREPRKVAGRAKSGWEGFV
jgi:hypothetical protein